MCIFEINRKCFLNDCSRVANQIEQATTEHVWDVLPLTAYSLQNTKKGMVYGQGLIQALILGLHTEQGYDIYNISILLMILLETYIENAKEKDCQWSGINIEHYWLVGWLVGFYGISTFNAKSIFMQIVSSISNNSV